MVADNNRESDTNGAHAAEASPAHKLVAEAYGGTSVAVGNRASELAPLPSLPNLFIDIKDEAAWRISKRIFSKRCDITFLCDWRMSVRVWFRF